jgi:hypothetical protein
MKEVPQGVAGQVGIPRGTSAMRQVRPPSRVTYRERSVTNPTEVVAKLITVPTSPLGVSRKLLSSVARRLQ